MSLKKTFTICVLRYCPEYMQISSFESTSDEPVDVCFIFDNTISKDDPAWDNSVDMVELLASYGISTEANLAIVLLEGGAVTTSMDDTPSLEEFTIYINTTMPSTPGSRNIRDSFEACLELFTDDDDLTNPTIFLVTHDGPTSVKFYIFFQYRA